MAPLPVHPTSAQDILSDDIPISDNLPSWHRTWMRWTLAVGLALVGCFAAYVWYLHGQGEIRYETVPVERGSIHAKVNASGTLNAVVDVMVSSQVYGNIKALYADWNISDTLKVPNTAITFKPSRLVVPRHRYRLPLPL